MSTKDDLLRAGTDELISRRFDHSDLFASSTSGSTGTSFIVRRSLRDVQARKLYDIRSLVTLGYRPYERIAAYTAREPAAGSKPQKIIFPGKWVSAFDPPAKVLAELSDYDPDWLWCYPSSFRSLLNYTDGRLNDICTPRALVTGAEAPDRSITDACKSLGIDHFNFYGAVETGRIAWECRAHKGLHVVSDNVVLEIIPLAGQHGDDSMITGETVITTLNNEAMPFIRYRLGDMSRFLDEPCPCGVTMPLIAPPEGRTVDVIRLSSGRLVTARGFVALVRQVTGVLQLQVTQASPQQIDVQLVVNDSFSTESLESLRLQLLEYLREPMDIDFENVDSIAATGQKHRDFVSQVVTQ